jgi:hypothetical protein
MHTPLPRERERDEEIGSEGVKGGDSERAHEWIILGVLIEFTIFGMGLSIHKPIWSIY